MSNTLSSRLTQLAGAIDRFSLLTGHAISWLTLAMVLISCIVVLMRYGLNMGSIALQESITYMHATVFLLGAAFTLRQQGHVRVDIFYSRFNVRRKAWVDSVGAIVFLLPLGVFLLFISWGYVASSWSIGEVSSEPGGIPAVYLLKSLIPLMAITLILQGVADIARNLVILMKPSHDSSR